MTNVQAMPEKWREFCRQAEAGEFPAAILYDARMMGPGCLKCTWTAQCASKALTPELSRAAATMLRMRSHWSSGKPAEAVELRSGFGLNELLAPWRAQR